MQAGQLAPQRLDITLSIAEVLLTTAEQLKAKAILEKVIQEQTDPRAPVSASLIAIKSKDQTLAQSGLEKAINLSPRRRRRLQRFKGRSECFGA
jgi:cytochrome c-type biogenesis protein CcmH/NrfG